MRYAVSLGLVLVGLAASLAAPAPLRADAEKEAAAKRDLAALNIHIDLFYTKYGHFPSKLKDLAEGPNGDAPIVPPDKLLDPWKKEYQYGPEGNKNGGDRPDIWTVTPGKKVIGNWMREKKK